MKGTSTGNKLKVKDVVNDTDIESILHSWIGYRAFEHLWMPPNYKEELHKNAFTMFLCHLILCKTLMGSINNMLV